MDGLEHIELHDEIGRGAFGRVHRGHHRALDIPVAVKVLQTHVVDVTARRWFAREARLMARIDHPNVLRVFEFREGADDAYLVLEWMDDGSLSGPAVDAAALEEIAVSMASGLAALHDAGVVHRDIKPANVLRRSDGRVKLADLGVAFRPETVANDEAGLIAGTLPYLAPELLEGRPDYGPRSDLYALGVTLHELWTGRCPFSGESFGGILRAVMQREYPRLDEARPGLSRRFLALIEDLMAADAADRPGSGADVIAQLRGGADLQSRLQKEDRAFDTIGPWLLNGKVYESTNWVGYAVHHQATVQGARLSSLQPTSQLDASLVLESARLASHWQHPGLVSVLDWGQREQRPYVVFAAVGQPLNITVRDGGPYDEVEALRMTAEIAEALAYVHARGYVYQMVEPGSVYVAGRGEGYTLAWPCFCCPQGASAELIRRTFVPAYAAPEVRFHTAFEFATDVYGLGGLLWFALSGQSARALDEVEDRAGFVRERLPYATAPTAELVAELLEPDPARRSARPDQVAARCRQIAGRLAPGSVRSVRRVRSAAAPGPDAGDPDDLGFADTHLRKRG